MDMPMAHGPWRALDFERRSNALAKTPATFPLPSLVLSVLEFFYFWRDFLFSHHSSGNATMEGLEAEKGKREKKLHEQGGEDALSKFFSCLVGSNFWKWLAKYYILGVHHMTFQQDQTAILSCASSQIFRNKMGIY